MTRRKVTMLEAFQDSERTSQDRQDAALSRNQEAAGAPVPGTAGLPEPGDLPAPAPAQSVHDGPAIVPVGEASRGKKLEKAEAKRAAAKKAQASAEGARLTLPFSAFGFAALQVLLLVGAFLVGRQFEEHGFGLVAATGAEATDGDRLEAASFGVPGRSTASRQDPTDAVGGSPGEAPAVADAVLGEAPG